MKIYYRPDRIIMVDLNVNSNVLVNMYIKEEIVKV